jgi:hypothetical protein
MQILCTGLRYPNTAQAAVNTMSMSITAVDASMILTTNTAELHALTIRKPNLARVIPTGSTFFGDDITEVPVLEGGLFLQIDLPDVPSTSFDVGVSVKFTIPVEANPATSLNSVYTDYSNYVECHIGIAYTDVNSIPDTSINNPRSILNRYYKQAGKGDGQTYSDLTKSLAVFVDDTNGIKDFCWNSHSLC